MAVHFHNDRQSRRETSLKPRIFPQHLIEYGRNLAETTYHRCVVFVDFLGSLLWAELFVSMFLLIILQHHLGVDATTELKNKPKSQMERAAPTTVKTTRVKEKHKASLETLYHENPARKEGRGAYICSRYSTTGQQSSLKASMRLCFCTTPQKYTDQRYIQATPLQALLYHTLNDTPRCTT